METRWDTRNTLWLQPLHRKRRKFLSQLLDCIITSFDMNQPYRNYETSRYFQASTYDQFYSFKMIIMRHRNDSLDHFLNEMTHFTLDEGWYSRFLSLQTNFKDYVLDSCIDRFSGRNITTQTFPLHCFRYTYRCFSDLSYWTPSLCAIVFE